jgi:hypothetical protein
VVLGVSIDKHHEDIKESTQKVPVAYLGLGDRKAEVSSDKYAVIGLFTTVIVYREGFIAEKLIGRFDFTSDVFYGQNEYFGRRGIAVRTVSFFSIFSLFESAFKECDL